MEANKANLVHVDLEIPRNITYQLVYRLIKNEPFDLLPIEAANFRYISSFKDIFPYYQILYTHFGLMSSIKMVLKILSSERNFYFVYMNQQVVHSGWITFSKCKYYWIDYGSAVVGPIWTSEAARGLGLATYALKSTINVLMEKKISIFYIDTSNSNIACQQVISKCGFGKAVAVYLRNIKQISI